MNLCDYGCGQKAIHQFNNGKYCCSKITILCPSQREKHKNKIKRLWKNKTYREKNRKAQSAGWTDEAKKRQSDIIKETWKNGELKERQSISQKSAWKDPNSKLDTQEYKDKISQGSKEAWKDINSRKKRILRLSTLEKNHPLFVEIEKPTEDFSNGQIYVRCKECESLFHPRYNLIYARIIAIERPAKSENCYFYCSEKCKEIFKTRHLNEFEKYTRLVYIETNNTIKIFDYMIDNLHLRGKDYHLDHKLSIRDGFINNIDPVYVGHYYNLEIIPSIKNLQKSSSSSITPYELLEQVKQRIIT